MLKIIMLSMLGAFVGCVCGCVVHYAFSQGFAMGVYSLVCAIAGIISTYYFISGIGDEKDE